MNVGEFIDLKGDFVLTIQPEATIGEAAAVLAKNHIGAIVVTDAAGSIVGILSERDVAVSLPRYSSARGDTKVSEIMTADVVTCNTETTVKQVLDIMVSHGIRHLPVVESDACIRCRFDTRCRWQLARRNYGRSGRGYRRMSARSF
jgi:CBS domain-containing protein